MQDEGEHWNATVKEKFDAELKKYKGELKKYEAKLKKVEAERNRDKVEAKYRVVSNVNWGLGFNLGVKFWGLGF